MFAFGCQLTKWMFLIWNISLKRYAFSRDVSDCEHQFSMDTRTQTFIVIHCLNMHSKGLNTQTFTEYILRVLSVWNDIFYGKWLYFWLQAIEWYLLDNWCINVVLCLNKNNYFFSYWCVLRFKINHYDLHNAHLLL